MFLNAKSLKNIIYSIFWVMFSLLIGIFFAEIVIQSYRERVARQGKIIHLDSVLGWRHLPNLHLDRLNSNGDVWQIRTNAAGYRSELPWTPEAERHILILGDSFAFGEGVNVEDRFDLRLAEQHPEWAFMNLGVMGYGTDQQFIAARDSVETLHAGDILLLLTYFNDYLDILRQSFAGRAKPWFELREGRLVEHSPEIGLLDRLRDFSYLFTKVSIALEGDLYDYTIEDVRKGLTLYRAIVESEIAPLLRQGIAVIIAHHGEELLYRSRQLTPELFNATFIPLCAQAGVSCIALDPFLESDEANFLPDRHWSARGHQVVAQALQEYFTVFQEEVFEIPETFEH